MGAGRRRLRVWMTGLMDMNKQGQPFCLLSSPDPPTENLRIRPAAHQRMPELKRGMNRGEP